jgi:type I restriction enzyme S subunit
VKADCVRLKVAPIFSADFVMNWLNSPVGRKQAEKRSRGIGRKRINLNSLKAVPAPIPPLNEQRRIVAKIEDLTARSQAAKQALDAIPPLLERFRQSVLAAAFRGDLTKQWRLQNPNTEPATELLKRIRQERRHRWEQDYLAQQNAKGKTPKDDKWKEKYQEPEPVDTNGLPELPEGWCWCCAQDLCTTSITKGTTPNSTEMSSGDGDVPYIKVYNLTMRGELDFSVNPTFVDRVTHETKLARSHIFPGDILMNIVGPPLGKVSLVPDLFPEWNTNQAVAIFRLASGVSKSFFTYRLLSQEALFWLRGQSRATSGQFNVSLADCRNLPVPLAPLEEQRKIEELVVEGFGLINRVESGKERARNRLGTLSQSILAKAFRGELVPQDPNDVPASALLERIRRDGAETHRPKSTKRANA